MRSVQSSPSSGSCGLLSPTRALAELVAIELIQLAYDHSDEGKLKVSISASTTQSSFTDCEDRAMPGIIDWEATDLIHPWTSQIEKNAKALKIPPAQHKRIIAQ